MPTPSEIVDNRTIAARLHRRQQSGITQYTYDGEDSLITTDNHGDQDITVYHDHQHHHQYHHTDHQDDSDDEDIDNNVVEEENVGEHEETNDSHQSHDQEAPNNGPRRIFQERVGGGKWPKQKYLFNSSSTIHTEYRKRKCHAVNCVHQFGGSCAAILLRPQLYPQICQKKGNCCLQIFTLLQMNDLKPSSLHTPVGFSIVISTFRFEAICKSLAGILFRWGQAN